MLLRNWGYDVADAEKYSQTFDTEGDEEREEGTDVPGVLAISVRDW